MSSTGNNGEGWLLDYELVDEFAASDYIWSPQIFDDPTASGVIHGLDVDDLQNKDNFHHHHAPVKKRGRMESCAAPGSKACREKLRRERLNDRFTELCSLLDPGKKPLKTDKVDILRDAFHRLHQLRLQAKKLKESNQALQDTIRNLKAKKLELRDEKTRLRVEKERMEQMLGGLSSITPPFIGQPPPPAAAMHATSVAAYNKTIPYPNFLPICMWKWVPPASLDTSQDHELRPPVA